MPHFYPLSGGLLVVFLCFFCRAAHAVINFLIEVLGVKLALHLQDWCGWKLHHVVQIQIGPPKGIEAREFN